MQRRVDYDRRQHEVYPTGRAMSPEAVERWMSVFRRHAPRRTGTVLDLGSGIGRFTPALAETFGALVYGVEPSDRMRETAELSAAHPKVVYLPGKAERIPLPGGSCDLVLLYLVLHHVRDRPSAAADISRVLVPGGRVLIRGAFAGRMPMLPWHRYFPRGREIEEELFPSLPEVLDMFAVHGVRRIALERVRQRVAPSLAAYAERLRLRPYSTFEHLDDEDTAAGFAALEADVAAEREPAPVEEECDLLVLGS
ncbi:class I SAM-dependent methyltransferase [Spongiactinospora sp. TRM90649]|uniref:class I SAM-dependent methyltransferase n=1 Tax=Spongiactinospora sp. TRM90649 TaxID=3031114 RepID=UPI0023F7648C|nr:class I SAM-dependent methyltransferase [Spongiactinospora sp. TRM90649]MDF5756114.1 class I SAM-dependent methyltransferase [Spongiactinospora sp. TRM90649]